MTRAVVHCKTKPAAALVATPDAPSPASRALANRNAASDAAIALGWRAAIATFDEAGFGIAALSDVVGVQATDIDLIARQVRVTFDPQFVTSDELEASDPGVGYEVTDITV